MIIKYTNDVVNSENDAVKAAKQMEEATLKALFARKNMVNVIKKHIKILRFQKKLD
jgi:ATP-dependent RNA circularization protein (DNA/RNA ligase family)